MPALAALGPVAHETFLTGDRLNLKFGFLAVIAPQARLEGFVPPQTMRHFVAYHKADDRGRLDRTQQNETEDIGSTKSLRTLQRAIGSRVWLFEGQGTTTGGSRYSLAYSFIADRAQDAPRGEERRLSGSSVIYFEDEALNDLPWFQSLKVEVANFSVGFQEVRSPEVVSQFEAYLTNFQAPDIGELPPMFYTEGSTRRVEVSVRERSASARQECISRHRAVCFICDFDFGQFYGERAQGFIEVHHRTPLQGSTEVRRVDPAADLVPLCANCHRVVHLSNPPMNVETLKELIRSRRPQP